MDAQLTMNSHIRMTKLRATTPKDVERAHYIIATMRKSLSQYKDYRVAMAHGYKPYMPTVPQDVYHFSNRQITSAEYLGGFDLKHPGSLLYEKTDLGGWKLVGAMYDAPASDTPAQLNQLIPLGIARWHQHINICLPNGINRQDVLDGDIGRHMRPDISSPIDSPYRNTAMLRMRLGYFADPRFGFAGTIHTRGACEAVGGNFHPLIFGWMVHVYPFDTENLRVAFSMTPP